MRDGVERLASWIDRRFTADVGAARDSVARWERIILPGGNWGVAVTRGGTVWILAAGRRCWPFVVGAAFHPVGQLADVAGRAVHPVPERRVRQLLASHVKIVSLLAFRMQAIRVEGTYWASLASGLPQLLATKVSAFHPSCAQPDTPYSA